ncbi:MAG: dihydrofolate reductase [Rhizobiaceae bacterium]
MTIIMVVAVASNNVIGNDGDMPWRLSTDLKRFKALTLGKPIIMGRKTFQSIGKPLPGRTSIVVTRDGAWQAEGVVPVQSIESAIAIAGEVAKASDGNEICIVGGGEIYRQAMDVADVLHVTRVHGEPEGDTVFPVIDPRFWKELSREDFPIGEKDTVKTTYVVYQRISP